MHASLFRRVRRRSRRVFPFGSVPPLDHRVDRRSGARRYGTGGSDALHSSVCAVVVWRALTHLPVLSHHHASSCLSIRFGALLTHIRPSGRGLAGTVVAGVAVGFFFFQGIFWTTFFGDRTCTLRRPSKKNGSRARSARSSLRSARFVRTFRCYSNCAKHARKHASHRQSIAHDGDIILMSIRMQDSGTFVPIQCIT